MTMAGAFCWGSSGHGGSLEIACEIAPPPFQPNPPNGDGNKACQHDDSEGRNVVPDDQSIEEIGGVVFHQNEDRMFVKRREGTVYKAPPGPPHSGEKKRVAAAEALERFARPETRPTPTA